MVNSKGEDMNSTKKVARVAGILYLLGGITAPFSLIYVPRTLIVPGDARATASHVRASETLLRMGIASELTSGKEVTCAGYNLAPALVGEGSLTLWPLVVGGNVERRKEQASAAGERQ
jgi:hypothetical protein